MSGKDTNRRLARVRHTVAVREMPTVRPPESLSLLVILNGAKRREGSGLRTRSLFRPPDPIRPRIRACSSAAPQDDSGDRLGFTLIELLVVISVVVLLMALLLAALGRARKQARAVVCRAHLRQWGTVLALYALDNEGRLPYQGGHNLWLMRGVLTSEGDANEPELHTSVRTGGIACCPMATKPAEVGHFSLRYTSGSIHWDLEGTTGSTFGAWQLTSPGPPFTAGYGFNEQLFIDPFRLFSFPTVHRKGVDTYNLPGKDCMPALFDAAHVTAGLRTAFDPPPRGEDNSGIIGCINRHDGTINGLFLDWSVRSIGLKELWTLKWNLDFDTRGPWTKAGGVQPEDWPRWMRRFKDY